MRKKLLHLSFSLVSNGRVEGCQICCVSVDIYGGCYTVHLPLPSSFLSFTSLWLSVKKFAGLDRKKRKGQWNFFFFFSVSKEKTHANPLVFQPFLTGPQKWMDDVVYHVSALRQAVNVLCKSKEIMSKKTHKTKWMRYLLYKVEEKCRSFAN